MSDANNLRGAGASGDEADRRDASAAPMRRAWANDARGALALVEGAVSDRVFLAGDGAAPSIAPENAFHRPITADAAPDAIARFVDVARARDSRAVVIADASRLGGARAALRGLAEARVGTVVHVLAEAGLADALALSDLGWGLLLASSIEESMDLALVARRAAEDCGTPFFVVHEQASRSHVEAVAAPSRELCEAFLGEPDMEGADALAGVASSPRAHAERVPFALASAMRALEALTGRHVDVLERVPDVDAGTALVAAGELGESIIVGAEELRAHGHDVAAVKITALRPFPGARLVKATSRALALSVLETADEPLAQSNVLAREVKAAFADALTWAPDYPGIGRIPRILSGVVGNGGHELEPHDLDAVVHNMLIDERGRRDFVFGAGDALAPARPEDRAVAAGALPPPVSVRGCLREREAAERAVSLCAAVVSSALGLRVRASVGALSPRETGAREEGAGGTIVASDGRVAVDLLADRTRPRGRHAPRAVRLVALDDVASLDEGNPLLRLADQGIVAFPTRHRSADALWSDLPAYAKAIVHARRARVVGWPLLDEEGAAAWSVAAPLAGLVLAMAPATDCTKLDGAVVQREVEEALASMGGGLSEARLAGRTARRAFESWLEVPRTTVERDEEALRLGRLDPRAEIASRGSSETSAR